jgi:hypothetical protein
VRGIPAPFINLDERGRDTPHPGLLALLPRNDFLDEVPGQESLRAASRNSSTWSRGVEYEATKRIATPLVTEQSGHR